MSLQFNQAVLFQISKKYIHSKIHKAVSPFTDLQNNKILQ